MTKEDLVHYLLICIFCAFMLNPSNLKHRHIHLTVALLISYLILFPHKHMKLKKYIYDLRAILLIYFVMDFEIDPLISLFIFILYLMIVYQVKYSKIDYNKAEHFTSMNTEVKKELNHMDNYKYDNKRYNFESEYKHDNEEDEHNGHKFISDKQLDNISCNAITGVDKKGIKTFENGYSAQGTSHTLGYNYEKYGELNKAGHSDLTNEVQ